MSLFKLWLHSLFFTLFRLKEDHRMCWSMDREAPWKPWKKERYCAVGSMTMPPKPEDLIAQARSFSMLPGALPALLADALEVLLAERDQLKLERDVAEQKFQKMRKERESLRHALRAIQAGEGNYLQICYEALKELDRDA